MTKKIVPESGSARSFLLDGIEIPFTQGQSVLEAAIENGKNIPHLCFSPSLSVHGSCRLCIVNINGKTTSACTTPAAHGLNIESDVDTIRQQRLRITQMLFVEGNHYCPTCEWSGNCQLQAIAYELGMTNNHYPMQYPKRNLDASHPDFILDHDRCIHCGLCERAGKEKDQKDLFALGGRGIDTYLTALPNEEYVSESSPSNTMKTPLKSSDLSINDHAAHICPVGALLLKKSQYQTPIGKRLYDTETISHQGNCRPENKSSEDRS